MRTTEIVRNPVIASICGHLEGTEGEHFFVLLSGTPRVRIAPGAPSGGVKKGPNTTKKNLEPASGTNPSLCDIIYLT